MLRRLTARKLTNLSQRFNKNGNFKSLPIPLLNSRPLSDSVFSFLDGNFSSKSTNHNFIFKYFTTEEEINEKLVNLSPEVISSMLSEAIKNNDHNTIKILLKQANAISAPTSAFEDTIKHYLQRNESIQAFKVLRSCDPAKVRISETLCQQLTAHLVNECRWRQAFVSILYMINADYKVSDRMVFLTVGGLMDNSVDMVKVLELLTLVVLKRRSDLAAHFKLKRLNRFSYSMAGTGRGYVLPPLPLNPLRTAMTASLTQLEQHGWFSFGVAKMLVGVACASGHDRVAAQFVRNTISTLSNLNKGGSNEIPDFYGFFENFNYSISTEVDIEKGQNNELSPDSTNVKSGLSLGPALGLLMGFSQADGIAQRKPNLSVDNTQHSEVTLAILEQYWKLLPLESGGLTNLTRLQRMDLMNNYWVLAYRCRDVTISMDKSADIVPIDELNGVERITKAIYENLLKFRLDSRVKEAEFTPAPGFERRVFRLICDEMGFTHKIKRNSDLHGRRARLSSVNIGNLFSIIVRKDPVTQGVNNDFSDFDGVPSKSSNFSALGSVPYRTFEAMMAWDNNLNKSEGRRGAEKGRKFDGTPLYWDTVRKNLISLSDEELGFTCQKLVNSMQSYPSVSWALLLIEIFQERGTPLPQGLLRGALKMSIARKDLYGMLEVLHASYAENKLFESIGSQYREKLAISDRKKQSDLLDEEVVKYQKESTFSEENSSFNAEWESLQERERVGKDGLTPYDWNSACLIAFQAQTSEMPKISSQEGFSEVMSLMNECKIELDNKSMQTLLRFLIQTKHNEELLWKLICRMRKEKNYKLGFIESIGMTLHILNRVDKSKRILHVFHPYYQSPNYLQIFPNSLSTVFDLILENNNVFGEKFSNQVIAISKNLHGSNGRKELFTLLKTKLSKNQNNLLLYPSHVEARDSIALLSIYLAYLLGTHDGLYSSAFELLFLIEDMYRGVLEADGEDFKGFNKDYVGEEREEYDEVESFEDEGELVEFEDFEYYPNKSKK